MKNYNNKSKTKYQNKQIKNQKWKKSAKKEKQTIEKIYNK